MPCAPSARFPGSSVSTRGSSSARRGHAACGHYLYVNGRTIFHKSSTSLHLWFYAMYLMTSTRCGISAKQLERELGVTYKTAWRMFHLIRNELMRQDDDPPLTGVVEMDEMYVGGRVRRSDHAQWAALPKSLRRQAAQQWSLANKTQVFGAVEGTASSGIDGEPRPTVAAPRTVTAHVIPSEQSRR